MEQFSRTEILIGRDSIEKLSRAKVAVFGIGGVGGYVVEGLARCGVGNFVLIDNDTICPSNLNRQIIATHKTIGRSKVECAKERVADINPSARVDVHQTFFLPDNAEQLITDDLDYIVDAIDTVSGKIEIIMQAKGRNIPVISCMGMGNKLNPTMIEVADISKTSVCPLAKVMRKELKKRGIDNLKVVFSKEEPKVPIKPKISDSSTKQVPGSISFVPSVAGLIIAGEVIKDLINCNK